MKKGKRAEIFKEDVSSEINETLKEREKKKEEQKILESFRRFAQSRKDSLGVISKTL